MRCFPIGLLLLSLMLTGTGCGESGPDLAPVSGRVTLDGRPLDPADVVFQPDDMKSPSFGRTNSDGRYDLAYKRGVAGALVGWHTVKISVVTEQTGGPQLVPPRYNSESGLRREVKAGEDNVFDFDLKSEGVVSKSSPKSG
jgi:hypothetical protein